jgi:hypothetical protein
MLTSFLARAVAPVVVEPLGGSLDLGEAAPLSVAAISPTGPVSNVVISLHHLLCEMGRTSEPQAGQPECPHSQA